MMPMVVIRTVGANVPARPGKAAGSDNEDRIADDAASGVDPPVCPRSEKFP